MLDVFWKSWAQSPFTFNMFTTLSHVYQWALIWERSRDRSSDPEAPHNLLTQTFCHFWRSHNFLWVSVWTLLISCFIQGSCIEVIGNGWKEIRSNMWNKEPWNLEGSWKNRRSQRSLGLQLEVCPQILNVLKIQRFILNPFSPHVTNLQCSNKSTKFSITLKENNTEDNFLGNWKQIQGWRG